MTRRPFQRSPLVEPREPAATTSFPARRPLVVAAVLVVVLGYPILRWLEGLGLVAGRPVSLAVLLAASVAASSTAGQRLLGQGRSWDLPVLRLAVAVALLSAFAWATGWSVALPVAAFVIAVRQIQRSGSHQRATLSPRNSFSSSGDACASGRRTTQASGRSSHF